MNVFPRSVCTSMKHSWETQSTVDCAIEMQHLTSHHWSAPSDNIQLPSSPLLWWRSILSKGHWPFECLETVPLLTVFFSDSCSCVYIYLLYLHTYVDAVCRCKFRFRSHWRAIDRSSGVHCCLCFGPQKWRTRVIEKMVSIIRKTNKRTHQPLVRGRILSTGCSGAISSWIYSASLEKDEKITLFKT